MRSLLTTFVALMLTSCATTESVISYPTTTTLKFTSPRCSGATCECRPLELKPEMEPTVAAGKKRFEFRLPRTTSAIWIDLGPHGRYYKAPQQVQEQCFTVDLPPGEHKLTLHSENRDVDVGLQTGLSVYEYGSKVGANWYHSLHIVCGGLQKCTYEDVRTWADFQRQQPRGVLDPCGSVMIRGVHFNGQRTDRHDDEYQTLTIGMKFKVYEFEPYHPVGSAECKAPIKNR